MRVWERWGDLEDADSIVIDKDVLIDYLYERLTSRAWSSIWRYMSKCLDYDAAFWDRQSLAFYYILTVYLMLMPLALDIALAEDWELRGWTRPAYPR